MSSGWYECIMFESVNVNGTYVCGMYVGFLRVYVCVQCLYVVCCLSVCLFICLYVRKSLCSYDVYVCWHICLYA